MPIHDLPDGRQLLDSGTEWERRMAYSRVVRVGPWLLVAGCLGVEADGSYAAGATGMTRQTERAFERIETALAHFGATLATIVRIRLYVTDIARWPEIAAAVEPRLGATRPANTLVEVRALAHPEALIEIEVDAWLDPAQPGSTPAAR